MMEMMGALGLFEAEPNLGFGVYGRYGFVGADDVGI
jgi:hypothetical protein